MKYLVNGKSYEVPNDEVNKLVDSLEISIAEACELWLSDHDVIENETVEELTKNAQKNRITATIHSAKGEKKERKPREKKVNPLKKEIIEYLFDHLHEFLYNKDSRKVDIKVTNNEKYIDFTLEDREFTINLVEHRKKKG